MHTAEIYARVARNLLILRTKEQLSQAAWAKKLDIKVSYVKAYETDRISPSYEVLEKISLTFKVSMDWIFFNAAKAVPAKKKGGKLSILLL